MEYDERKTGQGRAGAELTREALCRLIECAARVQFTPSLIMTNVYHQHQRIIVEHSLLKSISNGLLQSSRSCHHSSVRALRALLLSYYSSSTSSSSPSSGSPSWTPSSPCPPSNASHPPSSSSSSSFSSSDIIVSSYLSMLKDTALQPARGAAIALGRVPIDLLLQSDTTTSAPSSSSLPSSSTSTSSPSSLLCPPLLSRVIHALVDAANCSLQGEAETRRNAIYSLIQICEALGTQVMMNIAIGSHASLLSSVSSAPVPRPTPDSKLDLKRNLPKKEDKQSSSLSSSSSSGPPQPEFLSYFPSSCRDEMKANNGCVKVWEYIGATLLRGLEDYSTDNRGDVGSW